MADPPLGSTATDSRVGIRPEPSTREHGKHGAGQALTLRPSIADGQDHARAAGVDTDLLP